MAKIFISYVSEDKEFASFLARMLDFHHVTVWWCPYIDPGTNYINEITKNLSVNNTYFSPANYSSS